MAGNKDSRSPPRTWLDVEQSFIQYNYQDMGEETVNVSNLNTKTVTVTPKAVLCEFSLW